MSAWKVLIKNLYKMGGGPLRLIKFDEGYVVRPYESMLIAESLGLVTDTRVKKDHGAPCFWQLTELGIALCEGRTKVTRKNDRLGTVAAVLLTIGDTVDDATIERIMFFVGHQPGTAITPDILRAYSNQLVVEIRKLMV